LKYKYKEYLEVKDSVDNYGTGLRASHDAQSSKFFVR